MKKFNTLSLAAFLTAIFAPIAAMAASIEDGLEVLGAPTDWEYDFQKADSPIADAMMAFHDYVFVIIVVITVVVMALMAYIVVRFSKKNNPKPSKTTHHTLLEIVWTVIPILIVVAIIVPSMSLLYKVDTIEDADLTIKVTGYQWYWGYEYPDYQIEEFESRLLPESEMKEGGLRLLEVDNPMVIPVGKSIRILATGDPLGVIHAWGVPAFAMKRDTVPGRINEGWIRVEKPGIYYGQCYELCGPDHAYMPIKVIAVEEDKFNEWVLMKGGKLIDGELIKFAEGVETSAGAVVEEAAVQLDNIEEGTE